MELSELSKPEPLAKMAYEALRNSILSNTLTTGIVYNEKTLAKQLGISRTPVREALLELSSQGLMAFLPRKGVVVKTFTEQDIEEIFELRHIMEIASFKKVCAHADTLELSEVKACVAAQRTIAGGNREIPKFMEMDRNFHMAFARMTGNQRLIAIMENIRDMVHIMGAYALSVEGRMNEVVKEHEDILQSLVDGNTEKALALLERHLDLSRSAVKCNLPHTD